MANEIQTITVPNFVGASGFFAIQWPNYVGPDLGLGVSSGSLDGLTAAQAATQVESTFNSQLAGEGIPTKTISVTGVLDGTSLVLTVEFDGEGVAGTNVDQGEPADWEGVGTPVVATVQNGGPDTPPASGISSFGSGHGFGNLSHGNGFN